MMTDVALERVRHQPPEIGAADMDHRQMITGLEVDVRRVRQVPVDHHVNSIHLTQWRNGSGLAVLKQIRQLALARQYELSAELPADRLQIQPVARGNDRHQVAAVVFEHDTLRKTVSP